MPRVRHDCVVFSVPALPPGYVAPSPTLLSPYTREPERVQRPLPEAWQSKRPCLAFPAVSAEIVAALNRSC